MLNHHVVLHAIDATPARWRGDAGSSPPDRARTEHLTHWLISTQVAIIEDAEKRGELKPGMTVVEATSGNTGIAVAMVCAQRGYDCVICMAEPFSVERRRLMRMLGAKVIVTPKAGKGTGMVRKAEELCAKNGWFGRCGNHCETFATLDAIDQTQLRGGVASMAWAPEI